MQPIEIIPCSWLFLFETSFKTHICIRIPDIRAGEIAEEFIRFLHARVRLSSRVQGPAPGVNLFWVHESQVTCE